MAATLTMVPLAKIKPRDGFNPRAEFGDEQMAELVASVKQHGIITPLTRPRRRRVRDRRRGAPLPAAGKRGSRRYPPRCGTPTRTLTLAVAENVIRADLNPIEEARAYERLVAEHGDTAKVAKLVGRSELLGERLDLLRLPDEAQALLAARSAARLRARADPHRGAAASPTSAPSGSRTDPPPPRGSRPIPARSWTTCSRPSGRTTTASRSTRSPTASAAGMGRFSRVAAAGTSSCRASSRSSASTASGRRRLRAATRDPAGGRVRLAGTPGRGAARARVLRPHRRGRRRRPRLRLPARPGRPDGRDHLYVTDREWLADRLCRRSPPTQAPRRAEAARARLARRQPAGRPGEGPPRTAAARLRGTRRRTRAQPRPRRGTHPLAAKARHRRGQAARLARTAPLRQGGSMGAPPVRRAADDDQQAGQGQRPLPARRAGRGRATAAKRPSAEPRANTGGRARRCPAPARRTASRRDGRSPRADRQGVYEPQELGASTVLDKLARRRTRLGQTAPGRAGGRARTPREAWREGKRRSSPSSAPSSPPANPSAAPAASADQVTRRRGREARQPRPPRRLRAAVGQRTDEEEAA